MLGGVFWVARSVLLTFRCWSSGLVLSEEEKQQCPVKGLFFVSLWSPLANLFWLYRNRRPGRDRQLDLYRAIRNEKARLIRAGVSAVDVWRVSRCLKQRRSCGCCAFCGAMSAGRASSF